MESFNIERATEFLTGRLAQRGLPEIGMSEENVLALKNVIQSIKEKGDNTIRLWRFLCPPNYGFSKKTGKIEGPDFTPTMKTLLDNCAIEDYLARFLESFGLKVEITYVLDDFEKFVYTNPSLRARYALAEMLKNNRTLFEGLRKKVIDARKSYTKSDLNPKLVLFSDYTDLKSFVEIFEEVQSIKPEEELVKDVQTYLTDKYPELLNNPISLRERALRKIFQYAAEMRVIRKLLPDSIYLGTEYPVYNVGRMLSIEEFIAMLLCQKDSDLKPYGGAL